MFDIIYLSSLNNTVYKCIKKRKSKKIDWLRDLLKMSYITREAIKP